MRVCVCGRRMYSSIYSHASSRHLIAIEWHFSLRVRLDSRVNLIFLFFLGIRIPWISNAGWVLTYHAMWTVNNIQVRWKLDGFFSLSLCLSHSLSLFYFFVDFAFCFSNHVKFIAHGVLAKYENWTGKVGDENRRTAQKWRVNGGFWWILLYARSSCNKNLVNDRQRAQIVNRRRRRRRSRCAEHIWMAIAKITIK